jgi:hypothetical protein
VPVAIPVGGGTDVGGGRGAGVDHLVVIVAVEPTRIAVEVVILLAAFAVPAVIVDTVACDLHGAGMHVRARVVAICSLIIAVTVQVAEVPSVAVLINTVTGRVLGPRVPRRIVIVAVEVRRIAIEILIEEAGVDAVAVLVDSIARRLTRSRKRRFIFVVAVHVAGEAIAIMIVGRRRIGHADSVAAPNDAGVSPTVSPCIDRTAAVRRLDTGVRLRASGERERQEYEASKNVHREVLHRRLLIVQSADQRLAQKPESCMVE